jgi:hypothetical protein
MRPAQLLRVLLLFVLVGAVGCESQNKGKIEGKRWRSGASSVKGHLVDDGQLALDFQADGQLTFRAHNQLFHGTYRFGPGKTVYLTLDKPLAGRREHAETVEVHGDRLTMTDSDGTSLTFYEDR